MKSCCVRPPLTRAAELTVSSELHELGDRSTLDDESGVRRRGKPPEQVVALCYADVRQEAEQSHDGDSQPSNSVLLCSLVEQGQVVSPATRWGRLELHRSGERLEIYADRNFGAWLRAFARTGWFLVQSTGGEATEAAPRYLLIQRFDGAPSPAPAGKEPAYGE